MQYPTVKKIPVVDTYFDTQVIDNYHWLEDNRDPHIPNFVLEQNILTDNVMASLPELDYFMDGIKANTNYEKVFNPERVGQYVYYMYNSGLDNQPSLRRTKGTISQSEIVFDPIAYNPSGKTSIGQTEYDLESNRLAILLHDNGSDVGYIRVIDLATLELHSDIIQNVKFSSLNWFNDGIFYSCFPIDMAMNAMAQSVNLNHSIMYHKIGTSQNTDILIYQDKQAPKQNHRVYISDDKQVLILSKSQSTCSNTIAIAKLESENLSNLKFEPLIDFSDTEYEYLYKDSDYLYFLTNYQAPGYQVIKFNLASLRLNQFESVIPQSDMPINQAAIVRGKIIINQLTDVASRVKIYSLTGKFIKELDVRPFSQVTLSGNSRSLFALIASHLNPGSIDELNLDDFGLDKFFETELVSDLSHLMVEQVWYNSLDGTRIPMYIIRDKSLAMDGTNPTYLYGYGGFNISLLPSFVPARLPWLLKGGILAFANIRGGGEYGEKWHKSGTKLNKQNVFDDFAQAARYLIANKYTSSDHLAIAGASNGGLLTAVCGLQNPELFKLCIVDVGVLDMLRYDQFTIGWAWADDYGTAQDSKAMFDYLYKYSPVHNCKPSSYPRFLISTADHDDRVVPIHSYKFAASLQAAQQADNPILLQIHTKSGHGGGKNLDQSIIEASRNWAYTWQCCR